MELKNKAYMLITEGREFFFSFRQFTNVPSIVTEPLSGMSKVPIICNRVVFPAPLGPTILTTSPFYLRSMPRNTPSAETSLFLLIVSLF